MISRFVALGDSFTEGVGDDDPRARNAVRGWADRVAEQLAHQYEELTYANLAIRGRLLAQVLGQQLEPALDLRPDLVTFSAGANDLMRPKADIDALCADHDAAVEALAATGATVVLFTGVDCGADPLFRRMRGRTAVYNEHLRLIAARHGARLVDLWALRELRDRRVWSGDRIHLNAHGHILVAAAVLDVLGVDHTVTPTELGSAVVRDKRRERAQTLSWAREHALPWIGRRLRGTSSGDGLDPKRPTLEPVAAPATEETLRRT